MAPGLRNTSVPSFLRLPNRFAARSISLNLYLSLSLLPSHSPPSPSLFQLERTRVSDVRSISSFARKIRARKRGTIVSVKSRDEGWILSKEREREKEWTRPTNIVTRQRRIIDGLPSLWISRESRWRHKINRPSDKLKTSFLLNIHVARVPPLFPFFFFPCFGTHELAPRSRIYSLPRLVYLAATGEIDLPLEFVSSETARNELLVISCLEGREKSGPLGRRGIGSEIRRMNSFFFSFLFFFENFLFLCRRKGMAQTSFERSREEGKRKKSSFEAG